MVGCFGRPLMNIFLVDKSVIDPMAIFWPGKGLFIELFKNNSHPSYENTNIFHISHLFSGICNKIAIIFIFISFYI